MSTRTIVTTCFRYFFNSLCIQCSRSSTVSTIDLCFLPLSCDRYRKSSSILTKWLSLIATVFSKILPRQLRSDITLQDFRQLQSFFLYFSITIPTTCLYYYRQYLLLKRSLYSCQNIFIIVLQASLSTLQLNLSSLSTKLFFKVNRAVSSSIVLSSSQSIGLVLAQQLILGL